MRPRVGCLTNLELGGPIVSHQMGASTSAPKELNHYLCGKANRMRHLCRPPARQLIAARASGPDQVATRRWRAPLGRTQRLDWRQSQCWAGQVFASARARQKSRPMLATDLSAVPVSLDPLHLFSKRPFVRTCTTHQAAQMSTT